MRAVMMKCGCAAQGVTRGKDGSDAPVCVVHFCSDVATDAPDLTGRRARCTYCTNERDSSLEIAFFVSRPAKEFDEFYCGCHGWD